MTQEIITITVEAGQMTARRKSRKIDQRRPAPVPEPPAAAVPPRAAELENPYGRYYGTARSREDLKR